MSRPLRVVAWSTGTVGRHAIERMPGWNSIGTSSRGLPKPKISPITTGW